MMMIIPMGRDYVFELRPPTAYCASSQVIYKHGELRWNDIDREKLLVHQSSLAVLPPESSRSKAGGTDDGNKEFCLTNISFILQRVL
jgi:hypothetical protein